jgi:hypothetical protein
MDLTHKLFAMEQIESERLLLDWVSAGEGERFSRVIREFVEKIRHLGPFPLDEEMERKLRAIEASLEGEKIRWMVGKGYDLIEKENVYGERLSKEKLEKLIEETTRNELIKNRIVGVVESQHLSAKEISHALNLELKETLSYLSLLLGEGKIGFDPSEEGKVPRYIRK